MEHLFPLCLVTGATPLRHCRFPGWGKRSRSEPMLASSRGARTGPAPGKASKIGRSVVLSVLAVVLGAAGDEGLAEFLEADGVDGIEADPGIGFQEYDEIGRRLFQTNGHRGLGLLQAQL